MERVSVRHRAYPVEAVGNSAWEAVAVELVLVLVVLALVAVAVALVLRNRRVDDGRLKVRDMPFPPDSAARQALDDAYSRGEMSREHYEERVRRLGDTSS